MRTSSFYLSVGVAVLFIFANVQASSYRRNERYYLESSPWSSSSASSFYELSEDYHPVSSTSSNNNNNYLADLLDFEDEWNRIDAVNQQQHPSRIRQQSSDDEETRQRERVISALEQVDKADTLSRRKTTKKRRRHKDGRKDGRKRKRRKTTRQVTTESIKDDNDVPLVRTSVESPSFTSKSKRQQQPMNDEVNPLLSNHRTKWSTSVVSDPRVPSRARISAETETKETRPTARTPPNVSYILSQPNKNIYTHHQHPPTKQTIANDNASALSSSRPTTKVTKVSSTITRASKATTTTTTTTPWIRRFLAQRPKDLLLLVPIDYIADTFNLAQLPPVVERIGYQALGDDAIIIAKALQEYRSRIAAEAEATTAAGEELSTATQQQQFMKRATSSYPIYRKALQLILKEEDDDDDDEELQNEEDDIIPQIAIEKAAEALYLFVHARFVISPRGLEAIRHAMSIDKTIFGKCPRPYCHGCGLLPYGYSNEYTTSMTSSSSSSSQSICHRYCPSCGEIWISWDSKTDGCAWGPSWCHLFLLAFGTHIYAEELSGITTATATKRVGGRTSTTFHHSRRRIDTKTALFRRNAVAATATTSLPPSVFGFRVHPATPFGKPLLEQSLGFVGGASSKQQEDIEQ